MRIESLSLRIGALALVLGVIGACGSNDGPTGPKTPDISGSWRLSFTNMSGSGITCGTSAIDYVISQTGQTFTGTSTSVYILSCTDGATSASDTLTGAIITNGHLNGNAISFDLATSASHQSGTLSGGSMSGTATWTIDLGSSGTLVLSGQFGGAKL